MSLIDKINTDVKAAMLAREKDKLEAIRAVKAALLLAQTAEGSTGITAEDEIKILQRLVKQRKEAADIYKTQGRDEQYQKEMIEAQVIETYLPQQISDEELTAQVKAIIAQVGAAGPQDMGKVMGVASKQLAGKTEGKLIAQKVKDLLTQGS